MKKNKYLAIIILLIITMFMGTNKAYAKISVTCPYFASGGANDNNGKLTLTLSSDYDHRFWYNINVEEFASIHIDYFNGEDDDNDEPLNNWFSNLYSQTAANGYKFDPIFKDKKAANSIKDENTLKGYCPDAIIIQSGTVYREWGINDVTKAQEIVEGINKVDGYTAYYVTKGKVDENGKITKTYTIDEYYKSFIPTEKTITGEKVGCNEIAIFGDPKDAGRNCTTIAKGGKCESYPSPRYMINKVLTYFRIIVPALLVLYGTIDFAKAVISNEEEMKKAQTRFLKRAGAAIGVFLTPTLINILMGLTDEILKSVSNCATIMYK